MRNRTRQSGKSFILTVTVILVAVILGTLFTMSPASASAATSSYPHRSVSIQTHVHPDCTGSVRGTPVYQTTSGTASITWAWTCEGFFYVTLDVDWKDGRTTSYTCWSNCVNGVQTMTHTYTKRGTYYVLAVMGGNGSGEGSATVDVY